MANIGPLVSSSISMPAWSSTPNGRHICSVLKIDKGQDKVQSPYRSVSTWIKLGWVMGLVGPR